MKQQVLFSLKNNEEVHVFMNVVSAVVIGALRVIIRFPARAHLAGICTAAVFRSEVGSTEDSCRQYEHAGL